MLIFLQDFSRAQELGSHVQAGLPGVRGLIFCFVHALVMKFNDFVQQNKFAKVLLYIDGGARNLGSRSN